MVLRKSRSVWSEIPPWTIRIFPSMTVATGRRLKTSWNSWRISRPWVCKQPQSQSDNRSFRASGRNKSRIKTCVCTLYFCMTSFVNPYLKQQHRDMTMGRCNFNTLMFAWWLIFLPLPFSNPPEVHYVVLMVPSVQVHVVGVKQQVGEQEHDHFDRLFPTVHKVPVKHIWRLRRRKAILKGNIKKKKKKRQSWEFGLFLIFTYSYPCTATFVPLCWWLKLNLPDRGSIKYTLSDRTLFSIKTRSFTL